METLEDLLIEELKDLYSAEKQLVKAIPKLVKGAQDAGLKSALSDHLAVTKEQVARLEEVFAAMGQKAKAKHCKAMEGLIAEGDECLEESSAGHLRDLQIIGCAKRVEHYEMAAYGTARTMAEHCGWTQPAELLGQTEAEEMEADGKLAEVAEAIFAQFEDGEAGDEDMADDDSNTPDPETVRPAMGRSGGTRREVA